MRSIDSSRPCSSRLKHLITWATELTLDQLPIEVVDRTKELYVDWLGCAVAGRDHVAVQSMLQYAIHMGPSAGSCDIVVSTQQTTSPEFAALINGAASHVVEQDDLHNESIMHPATVVFPSALAVAQDVGATGAQFIVACVVGYEFACRTGAFLGKSHYEKFHTTATAGVIGAAAASASLLQLDIETFNSALGTAGTQAAGLWQFLLDASHSKQVHTAQACAQGVFSAYVAKSGLKGANDILEGPRGMAASLVPGTSYPDAIDALLGSKWAVTQSSFKWHASCRHTHPSVDALLALMTDERIKFEEVDSVTAYTYKAAVDVLSLSAAAETVHQSKFSMGFVLAVAAKNGSAMITDFTDSALLDQDLRSFQQRVEMIMDPKIDAMFPEKWLGRVTIRTKDGRSLTRSVEVVKGDPAWTLTRTELETKVIALAKYGGVKDIEPINSVIRRIWQLEKEPNVKGFAIA